MDDLDKNLSSGVHVDVLWPIKPDQTSASPVAAALLISFGSGAFADQVDAFKRISAFLRLFFRGFCDVAARIVLLRGQCHQGVLAPATRGVLDLRVFVQMVCVNRHPHTCQDPGLAAKVGTVVRWSLLITVGRRVWSFKNLHTAHLRWKIFYFCLAPKYLKMNNIELKHTEAHFSEKKEKKSFVVLPFIGDLMDLSPAPREFVAHRDI